MEVLDIVVDALIVEVFGIVIVMNGVTVCVVVCEEVFVGGRVFDPVGVVSVVFVVEDEPEYVAEDVVVLDSWPELVEETVDVNGGLTVISGVKVGFGFWVCEIVSVIVFERVWTCVGLIVG